MRADNGVVFETGLLSCGGLARSSASLFYNSDFSDGWCHEQARCVHVLVAGRR